MNPLASLHINNYIPKDSRMISPPGQSIYVIGQSHCPSSAMQPNDQKTVLCTSQLWSIMMHWLFGLIFIFLFLCVDDHLFEDLGCAP